MASASTIDPLNCTFEQYHALFEAHGGTDSHYLRTHFTRYQNTFKRVTSAWAGTEQKIVVDVGAHWLHQSVFYSLLGCKVEAFNVPTTFKKDRVKSIAAHYGINLTPIDQLETGECFYGLEESSIDVVLFTEILEHITFNPVRFWKIIYRTLKPGGRIIVTTPNFYSASGRAYAPGRFFSGYGSGLSVERIFQERTYGHHWKEYSMREVRHYFELLSSDFNCVVAEYTDDADPENEKAGVFSNRLSRLLPFLKPGLHIEIELTEKSTGIQLTPGRE